MDKTNKYSKVIKVLKGNKPVLADKEKLTSDIMERIRKPKGKFDFQKMVANYLFGWADIGWVRGTMAVAATVIIGIFIFQQVVISTRLNTLEKQLIKTVNINNARQPELGIMQKVLLNKLADDQITSDSITVSRSDLEELLNSFHELEQYYETTNKNTNGNSYLQKIINQNLKEVVKKDESKLKL